MSKRYARRPSRSVLQGAAAAKAALRRSGRRGHRRSVNDETDPTAYAHLSVAGARRIAAGEADRGIFLCGTGIGVAISANVIGRELALRLASEFIGYEFDPFSPSAQKVDAICSYEGK